MSAKYKADKVSAFYLSQNTSVDFSNYDNNNTLLFGAAGCGKSFWVVNNLIKHNDKSIITIDIDGEYYKKTHEVFKEKGYVVKCIDLSTKFNIFEILPMYNPFDYIKSDIDINEYVNLLVDNYCYDDKDYCKDAVSMLLNSLFAYVHYGSLVEHKNLLSVSLLSKQLISGVYEEKINNLKLMDSCHSAVKFYEPIKRLHTDSIKKEVMLDAARILLALESSLQKVSTSQEKKLVIESLAKQKTVLFIKLSSQNTTYDFMASYFLKNLYEYFESNDESYNVITILSELPRLKLYEMNVFQRVFCNPIKSIASVLIINNIYDILECVAKDKVDSFLDCFSTKVLLCGHVDDVIAEYVVKNIKQILSNKELIDAIDCSYQYLTKDEIMRLPANKCIVLSNNCNYVTVDKKI